MNHGADGPRVWTVKVLTLFPEMFPGPLGQSLAGKALENGVWALESVDIRSFARDKHRSVDDTPFGGGAGMVMRPDVLDAALTATAGPVGAPERGRAIYLSPRGRVLNQELVKELAATPVVTLLCGRYEGVDQRVLDAHGLEEVSLGGFRAVRRRTRCAEPDRCRGALAPRRHGQRGDGGGREFRTGVARIPPLHPACGLDRRAGVWSARCRRFCFPATTERSRPGALPRREAITEARRPDLWSLYQAGRPAKNVTNKGRRQARRRDPKPE